MQLNPDQRNWQRASPLTTELSQRNWVAHEVSHAIVPKHGLEIEHHGPEWGIHVLDDGCNKRLATKCNGKSHNPLGVK